MVERIGGDLIGEDGSRVFFNCLREELLGIFLDE